MNPCCINCTQLGKCSVVDSEKLRSGTFRCFDWKDAPYAEVQARLTVFNTYGTAGIKVLIDPNSAKD